MSLALFSAGVSRELSRLETSVLAELSPILDTGISAKFRNHFSQKNLEFPRCQEKRTVTEKISDCQGQFL